MKIALLILLLTPFLQVHAQLALPYGKAVMVDGQFSTNEWVDAYSLLITDSVMVYLKQSEEFAYIGIQHLSEQPKGGWVDIYIAANNEILNLHASRKLGERKFTSGQWPKWKRWWNNDELWIANFIRHDDKMVEGKPGIIQLPDSGWEFQIRKSKFNSNEWKLMFEISLYQEQGYSTFKYPANANTVEVDNWFKAIINAPDN